MSELRTSVLTGDTVILAPVRNSRPHSESGEEEACPFCPGQEDQTPGSVLELPLKPGSKQWFVRVFPNLFPIVSTPMQTAEREDPDPIRLAQGIHEVIVETPDHEQEMAQRTPEELRLTLLAYRERLGSLLQTRGVRYVTVFRNQGNEAGASLGHPHSQVVALRYVPRHVSLAVQRWHRYYTGAASCLLCDELARERRLKERVVLEQDGFVLFVPVAEAMSGEMVLAPRSHTPSFVGATDASLTKMSSVLLEALRRLQTAFEDRAFNLVLQTWPRGRQADEALHWYLRIIPRLSVLGGFELATGDYVGTLTPEAAAALYRGE